MAISLKALVEKAGVKPDQNGSVRVKTPVFRSTYAFVFEPRETPNGEMKYQVCMIFPKDKFDDLVPVIQAIANAAAKKFGPNTSKWPKTLKCPLRDGDEERDAPEYNSALFMNSGSKNKPGVVDRQLNPLMSTDEFYSGCMARASLTFYGYDVSGNKGVGTGLNNLLFWEDAKRLDGTTDAGDDFSEFKADVDSAEGF